MTKRRTTVLLELYEKGERDAEKLKKVLQLLPSQADSVFKELVKKNNLKTYTNMAQNSLLYRILELYRNGERRSEEFFSSIKGLKYQYFLWVIRTYDLKDLEFDYKGENYIEQRKEDMCNWIFDGDEKIYTMTEFDLKCESFFLRVGERHDKNGVREWFDNALRFDSFDGKTPTEIVRLFKKANGYREHQSGESSTAITQARKYVQQLIKEGKIKIVDGVNQKNTQNNRKFDSGKEFE